ncbi:MAG: T9SS type A sorting domain-containing protein [bacterium]|nr:T9SS type A sorting domain-containing protein [bacterium]
MRTILLTLLVATLAQAQPYNPVVIWDRSGAGDNAWYGIEVYALGDQNDDGYKDFMVWGLGQGEPGQPNEAVVELFHGGSPPESEPYLRFVANPNTALELYRANTIGDVSGDGYIDWEIWMRYLESQDTFTVQIYWGGPGADTIPDLTMHVPLPDHVLPIGDFNGDGYDDLLHYHQQPEDYLEILYGGNPMDTIPDWTMHSPPGHPYESLPQSFGDLNGDGYSDFVSDSPNERITYIFLGGSHPDTLPAYTWENLWSAYKVIVRDVSGDHFADLVFHGYPQWQVHLGGVNLSPTPTFSMNFAASCSWDFATGLGDINGDGYNDMAVIDPGCNNLWGTMCTYLGHPWLNPDPAITIQGREWPLNLIGIRTAAGLGDVNGDGIDDFAIGAANTNWDGRRGRVVVLSGDTTLHVGVDDSRAEIPRDLAVTVYPNPFNTQAIISLTVPVFSSHVELIVYNVLGQVVEETTLHSVSRSLQYRLDASALSTGLYLLRVSAGALQTTHKLVVLK